MMRLPNTLRFYSSQAFGLFLCGLILLAWTSSGRAATLDQLTDEQLRVPLLRLVYTAETWGELYPCPG